MKSTEEYKRKRRMNAFVLASAITVLLLPVLALMYAQAFGPVSVPQAREMSPSREFLITPEDSAGAIARKLKEQNLIRSEWAFLAAIQGVGGRGEIRAGAYKLYGTMDAFTLAKTLTDSPYLVWISIPEGLRKEQIAERLARELSWNEDFTKRFLVATENAATPFQEGVYFPDTYLIPSDQPPEKVAKRMQDRFREAFAPYEHEARAEGLAWSEVVTLASMIEREAAGTHDMGLIAGILRNRIELNMPLGVDATLQYIRGEEGSWWPVPRSEDKYLESPYNTYFKAGLPPLPISNPGLDTIKAVLNPDLTSCLYYLHDYRGRIHCATTYRAHVANIDAYLR